MGAALHASVVAVAVAVAASVVDVAVAAIAVAVVLSFCHCSCYFAVVEAASFDHVAVTMGVLAAFCVYTMI